jgi:hypothetical protein
MLYQVCGYTYLRIDMIIKNDVQQSRKSFNPLIRVLTMANNGPKKSAPQRPSHKP